MHRFPLLIVFEIRSFCFKEPRTLSRPLIVLHVEIRFTIMDLINPPFFNFIRNFLTLGFHKQAVVKSFIINFF